MSLQVLTEVPFLQGKGHVFAGTSITEKLEMDFL